jgi:hypothetical protein
MVVDVEGSVLNSDDPADTSKFNDARYVELAATDLPAPPRSQAR